MSNSNLVKYTKISPNKTSPRNHAIDTITIHCMAGNLSVETCGALFANRNREASSNYGIGSDGRVALYVDEKDRSWASSSPSNDHRAVTIEVANDGGASTGWHVSDKAYNALIELVADICKRNGIKKLLWRGDKSLIGQVDKQNMTVHRWFAAKACPGDYLYNKHADIAAKVNAKLTTASKPTTGTNKPTLDDLAKKVIRGEYGNGAARKSKITTEYKAGTIGYTYDQIQARVDAMLGKNNTITHVVQRGDTLSAIAKKYGTTVSKIAADNGIKNANVINIGQKLIIKK